MSKHKRFGRNRRARHKVGLIASLLVAGIFIAGILMPWRIDRGRTSAQPTEQQAFSIVALPDTQFYAQDYPAIFDAQTKWIVDHKVSQNIVYVSHLGDIVNVPSDERQWIVASKAFARLDREVAYGIAPGNHDLDKRGDAPLFAKYFPTNRIASSGSPEFFQRFESNDTIDFGAYNYKNSYRLLNAGGMRLIAFNLEFCPPDDVVAWTGRVLGRYENRTAIITTHSFIGSKNDRVSGTTCKAYNHSGTNGGEDIWNKLVVEGRHANILLVLNGHDIWSESGAARRTDYVEGHPVHQLMSDYQEFDTGGAGYLRIMTFRPADHKIIVKTYSPFLNKYKTDPDNDFTLAM